MEGERRRKAKIMDGMMSKTKNTDVLLVTLETVCDDLDGELVELCSLG